MSCKLAGLDQAAGIAQISCRFGKTVVIALGKPLQAVDDPISTCSTPRFFSSFM
jgi:hypothetical protein